MKRPCPIGKVEKECGIATDCLSCDYYFGFAEKKKSFNKKTIYVVKYNIQYDTRIMAIYEKEKDAWDFCNKMNYGKLCNDYFVEEHELLENIK